MSGGKNNGGWAIAADRERCIGSGSCAFAAPDVFDVDAEGRVVVVGAVEAGDDRVREAVASCPMDALRLIDDGRLDEGRP